MCIITYVIFNNEHISRDGSWEYTTHAWDLWLHMLGPDKGRKLRKKKLLRIVGMKIIQNIKHHSILTNIQKDERGNKRNMWSTRGSTMNKSTKNGGMKRT